MPELIVRGRCHPPQFTDPNYRGWTLLESEANKIMPKYIGKPVYIEHDKTKPPVGKVKGVYRDKDGGGSIIVDLSLDSNHAGWDTMKAIQAGELPELSISYDATGDEDTGERLSEARPLEISICKKGAMPDALIFAMKVDDYAVVSSQKSKSVYTSPPIYIQNSAMSTEQEQTIPASVPAVADPLSKYGKDEIVRMVKLAEEMEMKKLNELKDALANFVAPAYERIKLEDASAEIPNLGRSFESMMASAEGRDLINLTAKLSGNFLKFEKLYMEKQAEVKHLNEEKAKADASRAALQSEDERKTLRSEFGTIAPLFAVSNSGGASSTTDEPGTKRMRVSDMFGTSTDAKSLTDLVRNGMTAGTVPLPRKSALV